MSGLGLFNGGGFFYESVPGTCIGYLFKLRTEAESKLPQNRKELVQAFGNGNTYCLDFFINDKQYDLPFVKLLEDEMKHIKRVDVNGGRHYYINQNYFKAECLRDTIDQIVAEYERGLELKKVRGTDRLFAGDRVLYGGTSINQIKAGTIPTYWYEGRAGGILEVNYNVKNPIRRWWYHQNLFGYTHTAADGGYGGGGWPQNVFMLLCTEETLAQAIADKAAGKVWE